MELLPGTLTLTSPPIMGATMTTKLDRIRACAAAGDWQSALRIAARFPSLGDEKAAIVRAHEAFEHPRFYQQLGRDPAVLIAEGIAALRSRYRL